MIYKVLPSLENTDTGLNLELRGQIFTPVWCYSSCSCSKVLVNHSVKPEELSSVCLSLPTICRPSLSLLRDHLWHVPWDLQLARLRNDAFQEYFSHLWLFNLFHFKGQLAPLHITAKGTAVKERQWKCIQPHFEAVT